MATTCVTVLFILQPWIALTLSYLLPLLFSPVFDELCKDVVCGKGTCKPSNQSAFFLFECECYPGWKQASFGPAEKFKFLPCVVPDCTINYSCMNASSPVQDKGSIANESIFDPCHWTDCGGGFCNKTSNFTYSCECAKDYYNILNDTSMPCFQDCAIGMDCSTLGISNKSTSATQVVSDDGMNHAASILQGHYFWLIALMTFMAMMMCAKKWCVEKELASHQIKALSSSLNVNAILGGSRLTMALPKTSSFYLVWFPIVPSITPA
ncbi:slit like protein 2 protein [Quercus suber]|uniref:Slit like protein 2 protein n=1 Tax=Quercus suber TaxID=58331 RepID=A0AAW0IVE2_QUESU